MITQANLKDGTNTRTSTHFSEKKMSDGEEM